MLCPVTTKLRVTETQEVLDMAFFPLFQIVETVWGKDKKQDVVRTEKVLGARSFCEREDFSNLTLVHDNDNWPVVPRYAQGDNVTVSELIDKLAYLPPDLQVMWEIDYGPHAVIVRDAVLISEKESQCYIDLGLEVPKHSKQFVMLTE